MHRPYSESHEPVYIGFEKPVNGLGIAGFVVSLCGLLLTFGLICPIGIALSFFGLFKKPRGYAVAGLLIGAFGTALPLLAGYAVVKSHETRDQRIRAEHKTEVELDKSIIEIERFRRKEARIPGGIEGNKLVVKYKDGWDRELRYDVYRHKYIIRSAGPDGDFETQDDRIRQTTVSREETQEIKLGN